MAQASGPLIKTMSLTPLHRRILDISYRRRLSHIGSCLGAVDILDAIYQERKTDEPVILSCGHAGLALYCVLEKHLGLDAETLFARHGVHPTKAAADGIWASSGSLGCGISIAIGRALAFRNRRVWCVISDGELAEGATMEALSFAGRAGLTNLCVFLNANGYSAYREMDVKETYRLAATLCPWIKVQARPVETFGIPFLKGLEAHYHVMTEEDWTWVEANS